MGEKFEVNIVFAAAQIDEVMEGVFHDLLAFGAPFIDAQEHVRFVNLRTKEEREFPFDANARGWPFLLRRFGSLLIKDEGHGALLWACLEPPHIVVDLCIESNVLPDGAGRVAHVKAIWQTLAPYRPLALMAGCELVIHDSDLEPIVSGESHILDTTMCDFAIVSEGWRQPKLDAQHGAVEWNGALFLATDPTLIERL